MGVDRPFVQAIRRELADWRLWAARAVVIAVAALAGLTIVGFTWLTERALSAFFSLRAGAWWLPLLLTPACAAVVVWLVRRFAPGAAGSGIPQVIAALDSSVDGRSRGLFVSMRLAVAKVMMTSLGLFGGLSLGREGPSVQIAAGVMLWAKRWLPRRSAVTEHGLLVAGGAAGVAAAFNTPLAGVMFAIEGLSRAPEHRNSGLIIAGIVLAGLVAVSVYGPGNYFGSIQVLQIGWSAVLPGFAIAISAGVLGGLFAKLLVQSLSGQTATAVQRFRAARPVWFAAGCGFAVALIGVATNGSTFGSGYAYTRGLLAGEEVSPGSFVFFKMLTTWLSSWSGVSGGIFAPALAIGASLGNDIGWLLNYPHAPTMIALGMVGFLAGSTQTPLTSFIIVMEMVDGHAMVLSLMACSLVASGISRTFTRPLYVALAEVQLTRLPTEPKKKEPPQGLQT
ncbi:chloride channel protein [Rhizobacter sp. J219]|jgi:H+/Cl- antiporter ClcA|uniref:chloride channel protein n=1 Tax=Rhizobacter sp. J219 TaxID=2898430 RepID=UPI002151C307|nr:chloride channel protein [Rhizobacter sp. J219]MCR5882860.1 chloride channel protein [Rhizobacter sp. J219]